MESITLLRNMLASYKQWVIQNPHLVSDTETITKWASYFVAGKLNKSSVISELVYSLSNLFVLYNDTLIVKSHAINKPKSSVRERLAYFLTVLHFCEVFIEMTVRHRWGNKGKWSVAILIQLTKCLAHLTLVFQFNETPVQHPPVSSSQRKNVIDSDSYFTLKRSGRAIRKIENSPPMSIRTWLPLDSNSVKPASSSSLLNQKIAESIYSLKPVLHLGSVALFGSEAWKQWIFSFFLDMSSLGLYEKELPSLTYDQRVEISRRKLCLILYILRSPMYNKHSETIIVRICNLMSRSLPLARFICNPFLQYLPQWQDTYFYMWPN